MQGLANEILAALTTSIAERNKTHGQALGVALSMPPEISPKVPK